MFDRDEIVALARRHDPTVVECKMTDIEVAIERDGLRRAQISQRYLDALCDLLRIAPPETNASSRHARHLFGVLLELDQFACRATASWRP
jgi:hypothetical protein